MDGENEGGSPVIIIIVIIGFCCLLSAILAVVIWLFGGESIANLLPSGISDILSNFNFISGGSTNWRPPQTTQGGVFSFKNYNNFTVDSWANLGDPVSLSNMDDCNSKCATNSQCRAFTFDNGSCQLKNNASILDYKKGSSIWASNDVGATQFLKIPYKNIELSVVPVLRSNTGQLSESFSNCQSDSKMCKGFAGSSGNWRLFPTILAVDATIPGETYALQTNPPKFISEGHYKYKSNPSSSWTMDPAFLMPANYNQNSPPPMDHFSLWRSNWDAGQDSSGPLRQISGIPAGVPECARLCKSNAWCQAFVVGKGSDAGNCWMRHDVTLPTGTKQVCSSQALSDLDCPWPATMVTQTVNYDSANSNRDTYFKYQYPLEISCPYTCDQDEDCQFVTYDATNCKKYNFAPPRSDRQTDSGSTSVWKFDNFP